MDYSSKRRRFFEGSIKEGRTLFCNEIIFEKGSVQVLFRGEGSVKDLLSCF